MYHGLSGINTNRKEVISNYAVILMIIFYFQCEQIIPSVEKLQKEMKEKESVLIKNRNGKVIEGGFPDNLCLWDKCGLRWHNKGLPEIVQGFFLFYVKFKYDDLIISPNSGVPKLR